VPEAKHGIRTPETTVVDVSHLAERGGNDSACRPNQILAISLDHPVLDRSRWAPVSGAT
jgi:hypothetical protein